MREQQRDFKVKIRPIGQGHIIERQGRHSASTEDVWFC